MESSIELRRGVQADLPSVLSFIEQLAIFEREPHAVEVSIEELKSDFRAQKFDFFVAELSSEIVGIALFYERYSTWKGSYIHLEDLIVKEEIRGKGIGRMLLEAIIAESKKRKARRLGWEVLDWNTPAVKFYESIGASIEKEWLQCRMSEDVIENFTFVNYERIKEILE